MGNSKRSSILRKTLMVILVAAFMLVPVISAGAASYPLLRVGSSGQAVSKLQQELKNKGYFTYPNITGYYGTITRDAVIGFQKDYSLKVDGLAGDQTQSVLYKKTASQGSSHSTLLFRMSGQRVKDLQTALKAKGYFKGTATGYYGLVTERAVINFQIDNRLRIDGIAGPETQNVLFNSAAASTSTPSRGDISKAQRDEIFWLARIIHAEAQGESYKGKVAAGSVIMNRVKSKNFPNSVYDVIFEYYHNIPQFSPVQDGTIYNNPNSDSQRAAEEAYWGAKPVGDALYFFNPSKAAGSWIVNTRPYVTTIGSHAFYR